MKLYELIVVVVLWIGSMVGALYMGMSYKEASMIAEAAKIKEVVEDTRKQAMEGAADAISKLKVQHTTIQGRTETIIRDNPVYRDCTHAPDIMHDINEVLTGRTERTGDRSVPRTESAK